PAHAARPRQREQTEKGEDRMPDHVQPGRPGVGETGVEELSGVKDGGDRVAQQGLTAVMAGVPQRPATGIPFLLHPEVQRIEVVRYVAADELAILEPDRTIDDEEDGHEAARTHEAQGAAAYHPTLDLRAREIPDPVHGMRQRPYFEDPGVAES